MLIRFWNEKLNLELPLDDLVMFLSKTTKKAVGYFHEQSIENSTKRIHQIVLNTYYLKDEDMYECLIHEVGHFWNSVNGIRDFSKGGRHNKKFKEIAERLGLKCELMSKSKGYALTSRTDEFNKLLDEFKPKEEVWNIQEVKFENKNKKKGLRKYECDCGQIIYASNDSVEGECKKCESLWLRVESEGEDDE